MQKNNIKVAVKFRPLLVSEKYLGSQWNVANGKVESTNKKYKFSQENVFNESVSNEKLYDQLAHPIVLKAIRDKSDGVIFTYGQQSSGRTFSMIGDKSNPGIVHLAIQEVFEELSLSSGGSVKIRFMEITKNKLTNLLTKPTTPVKKEDSALKYLKTGSSKRSSKDGSTAIFHIIVEHDKEKETNLFFIDLGASDSSCETFASTLWALEEIFQGKPSESKGSKILEILSSPLENKSPCAVICTTSPADLKGTLKTIKFAESLQKVRSDSISSSGSEAGSLLMEALRVGNSKIREKITAITMGGMNMSSLVTTSSSPIKRRNQTIYIQGHSPKKVKLESDMTCDFTLFTSLMNQIGDVELEVEEKLQKINEQHEKIIEQKDKLIADLRMNLERTNERLIQVSKGSGKFQVARQSSDTNSDSRVKELEAKLVESDEKLKKFIKEISELRSQISFLEESTSASMMSAAIEVDETYRDSHNRSSRIPPTPVLNQENTVKALTLELERMKKKMQESEADYKQKLAAKEKEVNEIEQRHKEKARMARHKIAKTLNSMQSRYLE